MNQRFHLIEQWFNKKGWTIFDFQKECWNYFLEGKSGLLNAPTGAGKTLAIFGGILMDYLSERGEKSGLRSLWITPVRALAQEISQAVSTICNELCLDFKTAVRTGDTRSSEKTKQKKHPPQLMVITPENLHLLFTHQDYSIFFKDLTSVVVDEWHAFLGTKRAVLIELALSRLKSISPNLKIWGISATIGNLDEAMEVLFGNDCKNAVLVKPSVEKQIELETLFPDEIKKMPWSGHLGLQLLPKVVEIVKNNKSTLIFTNTRSQAEIWYLKLIDYSPDLSGYLALHHSSLDATIREWVEDALHHGRLKAVVCTSSLDLGVDFRPVDTVIQIGSAKGVSRFIQRAGRSGHSPGQISKIYYLPTHALELLEGSALRKAIKMNKIESKQPYLNSFDVLIQYLTTLAIGEGLNPDKIKKEVLRTYSFKEMTDEQWNKCLQLLLHGGKTLEAYDEFKKLIWNNEKNCFTIANKRLAMRHRLSIGTIVSDSTFSVVFLNGKKIGNLEEWFVTKLKPNDTFWLSGKPLEFVKLKDTKVFVKLAQSPKSTVPSWMGGRMPLSNELSEMIRLCIVDYLNNKIPNNHPELAKITPLLDLQSEISHIPSPDELLIEYLKSKDGYHLFIFPFEGRFVHEAVSTLIASRIAKHYPITFSIAMNDYGFELLTDQRIDPENILKLDLFSTQNLESDILNTNNSSEMAKSRFREIATIAGLVFSGNSKRYLSEKHIRASVHLFFKVFAEYEPDNILYQQAFDEVLVFQYEMQRIKKTFEKISAQKVVLKKCIKPSPFAFPIMVDRLRMKYSNEDLEKRIEKILKNYQF